MKNSDSGPIAIVLVCVFTFLPTTPTESVGEVLRLQPKPTEINSNETPHHIRSIKMKTLD